MICKCYKAKMLPALLQLGNLKDYTQYVKAEFMGCFWLIVKSSSKMELKSA